MMNDLCIWLSETSCSRLEKRNGPRIPKLAEGIDRSDANFCL